MLRLFVSGVAAAALMCGMPDAAGAQSVAENGRTTYEAAYFTQFSPSNALEIVRRVPGFTLEVSDEEVRGFGQAAGNLVINGQRASSKTDTADTILARIPASRVARVEVGSGDLFGSEFAGKPQVVNLVLTSGGGLAGTLNGTMRRDFTGKLVPEGSASGLMRRGDSSFNIPPASTTTELRRRGTTFSPRSRAETSWNIAKRSIASRTSTRISPAPGSIMAATTAPRTSTSGHRSTASSSSRPTTSSPPKAPFATTG